MLGEAVMVGVFGILFLQMACVRQQNAAEFRRRLRTLDRASKPPLHQQRQVARMIEMGVGKDHGFDAAGINGKPCPVPQAKLLQALEQATIDKNPMSIAFSEKLRSGETVPAPPKKESVKVSLFPRILAATARDRSE